MKTTKKKKKIGLPKPGKKKVTDDENEESEELDHDSSTDDPTQPDTETSHVKRHKIGYEYKNKNK